VSVVGALPMRVRGTVHSPVALSHAPRDAHSFATLVPRRLTIEGRSDDRAPDEYAATRVVGDATVVETDE